MSDMMLALTLGYAIIKFRIPKYQVQNQHLQIFPDIEVIPSRLLDFKLKDPIPGGHCKHHIGYMMLTLAVRFVIVKFRSPK